MTLDEVREICKQAKWTRETPLVYLFNELVEKGGYSDTSFADYKG